MLKPLFIFPKPGLKLRQFASVITTKYRPNFQSNCNQLKIIFIVMLLIGLVACSTQSTKTDDKDLGVLLSYNERDANKNTFSVEIFVNSQYLRLANHNSKDDFVLFDRQGRVIYNINADDKTILVIKDRAVDIESPIDIRYESVSQPSAAIPTVQGNTATHYRVNVNGEHCYDTVSMEPDFMSDAVTAMKEYRNVLAGEHAKSVGNIPKEMLDGCDLALNVFYASKYLDNGLPMREWDRKGYRRFLTEYKFKYKMPDEKLSLPEGYEKMIIF